MDEQNPFLMDSAPSGSNEVNPFLDNTPTKKGLTFNRYAGPAAIVASGTIMPFLIRMMMRGKGPPLSPATLEPHVPMAPEAPPIPQEPRAPLQLREAPISVSPEGTAFPPGMTADEIMRRLANTTNPITPSGPPPRLALPPSAIHVTPQGTAIPPGTTPEAILRAQKIEALGRAMQDPEFKIKYFGAAPLSLVGPSMGESQSAPSPADVGPMDLIKKAAGYVGGNMQAGQQIMQESGLSPELMGFMGGPNAIKGVASVAEAQAPGLIKKGIEAIKHGLQPKFGDVGMEGVRAAARKASGETSAGVYLGQKLTEPMKDFTPQEKILAGEALRGAPEPMAIPKIQQAVAPMRAKIDELSDEIAQNLDPVQHKELIDEIQKNSGTYVRRVYGRDILGKDYTPPQSVVNEARTWLTNNLADPSPINVEATMQEIIAGKSQALNVRGAGLGKLQNLTPRAPETMAPKAIRMNISPLLPREEIPQPIRALMGEVIPGDYVGARTVSDLSSTLANLKFFKTVAAEPNFASDVKQLGWKQMPQAATLGALSGKYVPEVLYNDLQELANPQIQEGIDKLYFSLYNAWRFSKTALDPVTHSRNVLGNIMFSGLAKISPTDPHNWTFYKQALQHLHDDTPLKLAAYKDGIIGTEMMGADIKPFLRDVMAQRGDNFVYRSLSAITSGAEKVLKPFGNAYQWEDQVFKMASYIKQLSLGDTAAQAAAHVDRWFPNYKELPRWLGHLKTSKVGSAVASPFTSFGSEAVRIFKNAVKDPERFGTLARWLITMPIGLTAISAAQNHLSPQEVWDLYRSMPRSEKNKGPYNILVPWRDSAGALQVADMSPIIPMGNIFQNKSMLAAIGMEDMPLVGNFVGGNPFVLALAQGVLDKNIWTEQPLTRPSDVSETTTKLSAMAKEVAPIPTSIMRAYREYKKGKAPLHEQVLEAPSPVRFSSVPDLLMREHSQMSKEKTNIIADAMRAQREGSTDVNPFLGRGATAQEQKDAATRIKRLEAQVPKWETKANRLEKSYYRSGGH